MATTKPRITITLEPEVYDLFKGLSEAQGRPMARIISELLTEVSPPLQRTLSLLMAAKQAPKQVLEQLAANFEMAERDVKGMFGESMVQLDALLGDLQRGLETGDLGGHPTKEDARENPSRPPSCNTGVTTGTPTAQKPKSRTSRG